MMLLVVIVIIGVLAVLRRDALSHVPGPWTARSRIPLAHSLVKGTLVQRLHDLHATYGRVVRVGPSQVSVSSEVGWKMLSRSPETFLKDPAWWGGGMSIVATVDPAAHRRIRRLIAPEFSGDAARRAGPVLRGHAELLCERMSNFRVVDVVPWLNFATFDMFASLAFDASSSCLRDERYHPLVGRLFGSLKVTALMAATRLFPGLQRALAWLVPQRVRDEHDRDILSSAGGGNMLARALANVDSGVSVPEVLSTFRILSIAGSETTATALSGILHHLVACPEKLVRLEGEVRGLNGMGEELRGAEYLDAVIREGLRLCLPIPVMLPRVVPSGGATVDGVYLPEGTSVIVNAYAMNRDPSYFHDPTHFLPERWLPSQHPQFANDKRHIVQPFGVGPRSCLGQPLAWAEMRFILALLLREFDLSPAPDSLSRWEDLRTFVVVEKRPIRITLTPRRQM